MGPLKLNAEVEEWQLLHPFRITGHTFTMLRVVVVTLSRGFHAGRGEAIGIYYRNDNADSILRQIESHRAQIEAGVTRRSLQDLLPAGGARNAVDCALWDLEAKESEKPVWQLAEFDSIRDLVTTFGCGADTPEAMATLALTYSQAKAIKLKLTGEPVDAERVRAVREARPDVWLGVDANQGFSRPQLEILMPTLIETRVKLIEQPFAVGQDHLLDGFQSPIPIAADESVQSLSDIDSIARRFNVINIKLDKCGGLTEALAMARASRKAGLGVMIGNMLGTSLAMAPACIVGQLCDVVDLDGPLFLKDDREFHVEYVDGRISLPSALWGSPDI